VSICYGDWTTTIFVYKPPPQSIAVVRRVGMTVGSHPSPTAPEADIKTFPSPLPPTTKRTDGYIEERVFENFQNFREPRFKMSEPGKGVNTRTNNLRVHTADSNTRTTSIGTTARSRWLEWRSHRCPKVTGTTSVEEAKQIFLPLVFFCMFLVFAFCCGEECSNKQGLMLLLNLLFAYKI